MHMEPGVDYPGVAVGVFMVDHAGKVYLARRSATCRNEPDCWDMPGGEVEMHEKLADAARREMQEEHGVRVELVEQWPAHDHMIPRTSTKPAEHWVTTTFLARMKPRSPGPR